MYKLVDLDPVLVDLVLFGGLEFKSHIGRYLVSRTRENVIFENEEDCNKFLKDYNELLNK